MPLTNEDFEKLRGLQIGLQEEVGRQYNDLKALARQIASLKAAIASVGESAGGDLSELRAGLDKCAKQIRHLTRCVNELNRRLLLLEQHPSNGPIAEWQRLSTKRKGGYLGGLGTFLGGVVLLIAARGGTVEAFGAKFSAPEMSAAGIIAAAGGVGVSGWAVAKKDSSE